MALSSRIRELGGRATPKWCKGFLHSCVCQVQFEEQQSLLNTRVH
eukprot:COSAG05_NODE_12215_length_477_cov_0.997354_2_plen_44_part_01